MGEHNIRVTIANRNLDIETDEDVEYILELSRFIEDKIKDWEDKKVPSLIDAILLAALNITDELFKQRKEIDNINSLLESKSQSISEHLRQILPQA